ncbi:MAG: 50S ribosomal protein L15 [Coriobacteriia bacterium]|nr:50S ribosomal protein L15 [Coriobacteriia bacterium]
MQLHDLAPTSGSKKDRKRVGRGHGSGHGKTATRGYNGQKSRAGGAKANGFEGGQTPLARRLPKLPGFTNINRVDFAPVNVGRLEFSFDDGDIVDAQTLVDKGIIKNTQTLVKILGDGSLTKSLTVRVDKVSATAAEKIISAGGKVEAPC